MPQPSSRAKDIHRTAAAVAGLGTMGYFGIGVCIGVTAFLVYRYFCPPDPAQQQQQTPVPVPVPVPVAISPGPVQRSSSYDHDDDTAEPGPSNGNPAPDRSNIQPSSEDTSHSNAITQWRNEVERRTSSNLRHRTNPNTRPVDQSTGPSTGFSTPSTFTTLDSLADTTTISSRPPSPTPRASPTQSESGNDDSLLLLSTPSQKPLSPPPAIATPSGSTNAGPDHIAIVPRYHDQLIDPGTPPSSPNSTARTPIPTQHIRSSLDDGARKQADSSFTSNDLPTPSPPSELDFEWSSTLPPDFPHFDLPGFGLGEDVDVPSEPSE